MSELGVPDALNPEPEGKAIAVAVTVSSQVNPNRSIVLQTYLPRDAGVREYHDLLDKMTRASDRQEAKANLVGLKASLAQHKKQLAQLETDYTAIEPRAEAMWKAARKKGDFQLSANESAQKGIAEQNIKRYRDEIVKIEVEIATCQTEIARED